MSRRVIVCAVVAFAFTLSAFNVFAAESNCPSNQLTGDMLKTISKREKRATEFRQDWAKLERDWAEILEHSTKINKISMTTFLVSAAVGLNAGMVAMSTGIAGAAAARADVILYAAEHGLSTSALASTSLQIGITQMAAATAGYVVGNLAIFEIGRSYDPNEISKRTIDSPSLNAKASDRLHKILDKFDEAHRMVNQDKNTDVELDAGGVPTWWKSAKTLGASDAAYARAHYVAAVRHKTLYEQELETMRLIKSSLGNCLAQSPVSASGKQIKNVQTDVSDSHGAAAKPTQVRPAR